MNIKLSSLNKGLVLHQTLSRKSSQGGMVLADKTPYENVGTKYGSVLKFDGVSNNLVLSNLSPAIPSGGNYTQSVWINCKKIKDSVLIDDNNRYEHYIQLNASGAIYAGYYNGQHIATAASIRKIEINKWYHLVSVVESGISIKLYVNGEIWAKNSSIGGIQSKIYNDSVIGASGGATQKPFNGLIGETRIYSRALSPTEVNTLYHGGVVDNTGLVAHYKMKDKTGTILTDETGVNNGALTNFVDTTAEYGNTHDSGWTTNDSPIVFALDRKGNEGGISFDGVNDYIDCGNHSDLKIVDKITMSIWVKPFIQTANYKGIVDKESSTNRGYGIRTTSYTSTTTTIQFKASNGIERGIGEKVTNNIWSHIVGVYDGNNLMMFVDGVSVKPFTSSADGIFTTETNLKIGGLAYSSTFNFSGLIDDVRIYNRALSEEEIKTLYNSYNPNIKMKTSLPKIKFSRALKGTFVDSRDGTEYKTIKIGNQTWMAENLKYLPSVVGPATGSATDPYYYVYDYNGTDVATAKATTNYQTYGVLYNWTAAATACPAGWHLPSDEEFKTLEKYLGMTQEQADATGWRGTDEGDKLKESGTAHWVTGNIGTNTSGFAALGAGCRYTVGNFNNKNYISRFWNITNNSTARYLSSGMSQINRIPLARPDGISVRCIRDY